MVSLTYAFKSVHSCDPSEQIEHVDTVSTLWHASDIVLDTIYNRPSLGASDVRFRVRLDIVPAMRSVLLLLHVHLLQQLGMCYFCFMFIFFSHYGHTGKDRA